ncbi:MAG TPA: hypothetical protein VF285_06600 [Castellaniella sp.]|uniref:antitoxin PaaA2 family protein n=1 Tax=Castellaniella sp. TaxID=1955812 RepID=UPI002EEB0926
MHTYTIGTDVARQLVRANAVAGAAIVGQPGGWSVMLQVGTTKKLLGTQRSDKARTWRSLDSCVQYLRDELSIVNIDHLDATNYTRDGSARVQRPDTTARLKQAHEAAAYDRRFRASVQAGIDDPHPNISGEEVDAHFAKKRADLRKRIAQGHV